MIKFFRSIRQQLLMKNKTRQYFKYAIGEIILVMVGILLALQVNNWNQKRVERNEIQAKFLRVLEEIDITKRSIDGNIKSLDSLYVGDNQKSLYYLKSNNKDSVQKLSTTLGQFGNAMTIVIDIPSIDDFLNSGYLSKISNPDIKKNMLLIKKLKNFSYTLDTYANEQLNTHITPYYIKKLNLAQLTKNPNMTVLYPIKDYTSFIGDRELENLLNLKIETDTGKITFLRGLKHVLNVLEQVIKEEVKN